MAVFFGSLKGMELRASVRFYCITKMGLGGIRFLTIGIAKGGEGGAELQ